MEIMVILSRRDGGNASGAGAKRRDSARTLPLALPAPRRPALLRLPRRRPWLRMQRVSECVTWHGERGEAVRFASPRVLLLLLRQPSADGGRRPRGSAEAPCAPSMAGKRGKATRSKPKRRAASSEDAPRQAPPDAPPRNFVAEAGQGCHIAHGDASWVVNVSPFDPDDFVVGATLPDLGIDAGRTPLLTAVNTGDKPRSYVISTPHACFGAGGRPLARGWTRDDAGVVTPCTTLIVVAAPRTLVSVAHLQLAAGEALSLDSDVQEFTVRRPEPACVLRRARLSLARALPRVQRHEDPAAFDPAHTYGFPLGGAGPLLCTQGVDGALTHFFAGTHHAVDFRCPVGTPVLSVAPGRVADVRMSNTCGGVHVRNLFKWNSIMARRLSAALFWCCCFFGFDSRSFARLLGGARGRHFRRVRSPQARQRACCAGRCRGCGSAPR